MKKTIFSLKWVALALICTTISTNLLADTAKVVRIKGAARYSAGNNVWVALREGDVLKAGSVIQTASESSVDIIIGAESDTFMPSPVVRRLTTGANPESQQNIIRLRENTVLALDKLYSEKTGTDTVTDTQLDLRAGRIFGNVKKLSAASRYEVKLPNGVAGIRGTLFDLSADGVLKVFFGSVVISYFDKDNKLQTQTVLAGWVLDLNSKQLTKLPSGATSSEGFGESTLTKTYTTTTGDHTIITVSPVLGDNTPPARQQDPQ